LGLPLHRQQGTPLPHRHITQRHLPMARPRQLLPTLKAGTVSPQQPTVLLQEGLLLHQPMRQRLLLIDVTN